MPELGYKPVNKYLPPRPGRMPRNPTPPRAPTAARRSGAHRRQAAALGRPAAVALTARSHRSRRHASRSFDRLFHDRVRRRLRALALLGLGAPLGLAAGRAAGSPLSRLPLAIGLAAAGLGSSVFHLGRPERAWRAFSQWRSSWLSREGVFSVLTFLPTAVFGIGWVFFGATRGFVGLCGIIAAALAAVTVYCTGMIYASLKPIHQWHNGWVVPGYLALGLMGGLLVLDFLVRLWVRHAGGLAVVTLVVVVLAWWLKERYWLFIDTTSARSTVASATALGSRGRVRRFENPHTEENYLLKEMGFQIARKHARRLRRIVRLAALRSRHSQACSPSSCPVRRARWRPRSASPARRSAWSSNAGCFLPRQSTRLSCITVPTPSDRRHRKE